MPVDNSKRFLVELLAFELWKVEQEEQSELARVAAERMAVTS